MTDHRELRARLVARLARLTNRAERIEQDLRRPGDRDWTERAIEIENDEVLEGLDELTLAEVEDLRRAIERIDAGKYGSCTMCGRVIDPARLEALPATTRCVRCAAAA